MMFSGTAAEMLGRFGCGLDPATPRPLALCRIEALILLLMAHLAFPTVRNCGRAILETHRLFCGIASTTLSR